MKFKKLLVGSQMKKLGMSVVVVAAGASMLFSGVSIADEERIATGYTYCRGNDINDVSQVQELAVFTVRNVAKGSAKLDRIKCVTSTGTTTAIDSPTRIASGDYRLLAIECRQSIVNSEDERPDLRVDRFVDANGNEVSDQFRQANGELVSCEVYGDEDDVAKVRGQLHICLTPPVLDVLPVDLQGCALTEAISHGSDD